MHFSYSLRRFPNVSLLGNSLSVHLIGIGPVSSIQGRSASVSSFYASLFQAFDDVMSLTLCPQVESQASQHFRFLRDASHL